MKNFIVLLLTLSFTFSATAAVSEKSTLETLKGFSSADMKADKEAKAKKQKTGLKIDEMFKTLDETVTAITKKELKSSPELIRELSRVALLTFENDPSLYAAELLLPIYSKDKAGFEKAISGFSKADRDSLLTAIKDKARESSQGNG